MDDYTIEIMLFLRLVYAATEKLLRNYYWGVYVKCVREFYSEETDI